MIERDTIEVGKIGLAISSILWILCTWRLGFHTCWDCLGWTGRNRGGRGGGGRRDGDGDVVGNWLPSLSQLPSPAVIEEQSQQQRQRLAFTASCVRWITRRRAFHGLLWIATLCEVVSYADLSRILSFTSDRILAENIGYVLLNVLGRTFELLAFCTVTEIWIQTAIDARPRSMHSEIESQKFWLHWLTYIFVFFTALLVLASVVLSVDIFSRFPYSPNREFVLTMPLSMLQTILETFCWGMNTFMTAISIAMTTRCVLVLVPSTEWKRRLYLWSKAVGPMVLSFFAYATRCGWLMAAYLNEDRRDTWAWWISFAWMPTATVSIMLLYSTRKRDHDAEDIRSIGDHANGINTAPSDGDDTLRQSLLRSQPPEEAFRAFHHFRRGEEDPDDSFSLGSPVPRRNVVATTTAGDDT